MSEQPEALRLAEKMESYSLRSGYAWHCHKAAAELRRLHELNQELVETLNIWLEQYKGEEYEDCPEVEKTRATLAKAGEKK